MSNETASQSRNRTDTPRTDAKAGFANFDDAMKGGPGNVVPADFARELEQRWFVARELEQRWFVAREHAITIPGEARPSIGYIVVPKWPTFASFDEAAIFIKERDLPIGWVALRESQLAKRVPSATLERK